MYGTHLQPEAQLYKTASNDICDAQGNIIKFANGEDAIYQNSYGQAVDYFGDLMLYKDASRNAITDSLGNYIEDADVFAYKSASEEALDATMDAASADDEQKQNFLKEHWGKILAGLGGAAAIGGGVALGMNAGGSKDYVTGQFNKLMTGTLPRNQHNTAAAFANSKKPMREKMWSMNS